MMKPKLCNVMQCVMFCLKGMCKVEKYSESSVSVHVTQLHLPALDTLTLAVLKGRPVVFPIHFRDFVRSECQRSFRDISCFGSTRRWI